MLGPSPRRPGRRWPPRCSGRSRTDRVAAAVTWLARVRSLASNLCTIAVPFAQTDLTAVAAVGNDSLSAEAVTAPSDVIDAVLSIKSTRGVSWPDAGSIDDRTGSLLRKL